MTKIKLLICYHKKTYLLKDEILTPIHVGRANCVDSQSNDYSWLKSNMIGDNTGCNISKKNYMYNELTALYWAWKNYDDLGNPEYIGLMHYRRHYAYRKNRYNTFEIRDFSEKQYFKQINYSISKVKKIVKDIDFLPHLGRVENVYNHYAVNHKIEDLDLAILILLEKYPEYKSVIEEYLNGNISCFCNMCIFNKKLFFDYCAWIFDILEEFEKRRDCNDKRFFISERLTGIYVHKLMQDKRLKYRDLPISLILEPQIVPLIFIVFENSICETAVVLQAILENSEKRNYIEINIFTTKKLETKLKSKYLHFSENYENSKIKYIVVENDILINPEYVVKHLNYSKCIFLSERVIAISDISYFLQNCYVDEYSFIVNHGKNISIRKDSHLSNYDLAFLNCDNIRKGKVNEIGYIPDYLYMQESALKETPIQFKNWSAYHSKLKTKIFVIYDTIRPFENFQGVYSKYWWDYYFQLPVYLQKIDMKIEVLYDLLSKQEEQVEKYLKMWKRSENKNRRYICNGSKGSDDWMTYSLLGKIMFYYKYNGFINTCYFIIKRLVGRG